MLYLQCHTEHGCVVPVSSRWTRLVEYGSISPTQGSVFVRNSDYEVICVYANDTLRIDKNEYYEIKGEEAYAIFTQNFLDT